LYSVAPIRNFDTSNPNFRVTLPWLQKKLCLDPLAEIRNRLHHLETFSLNRDPTWRMEAVRFHLFLEI